MDTPFDFNAAANDAFQSGEGVVGHSGFHRCSPLERARLMPIRTGAKRLIAMTQAKEAIARITQIRSRLAPISERLLVIEAGLAVAKAADNERPAKVSLREFTSNLLDQTLQHSPWTDMVEKYGIAAR
jgi:hypothetical protein